MEKISLISSPKNDIGNSISSKSKALDNKSSTEISQKIINWEEDYEYISKIKMETVDIPIKEALKDKRTWIIFCVLFFSLIQGNMNSLLFKNYGLENIPDDAFITFVGTIGAVTNGLSRGFWGVLVDKYQYKYVYGVLFLIQAGIGFTISLISSSKPLYLIWIAISFF